MKKMILKIIFIFSIVAFYIMNTESYGQHKWVLLYDHQEKNQIIELKIDHKHPEIFYALIESDGIYRLTNYGRTFVKISPELRNTGILSLAVDK